MIVWYRFDAVFSFPHKIVLTSEVFTAQFFFNFILDEWIKKRNIEEVLNQRDGQFETEILFSQQFWLQKLDFRLST